jgi:hypothetical protein
VPRDEVRIRTPSASTYRIRGSLSGEGAHTGDVLADDERLDGLGALVGVNGLHVGYVPDDVEVERVPLPPSRSRAAQHTWRALRVLFIFASAAMVSVSQPSSTSRPAAGSTAASR